MPRASVLRRIEVAAGILRDGAGRILLAERTNDPAFRGLWEFPGGKLDEGETPETALARELLEELGITIAGAQHLLTVDHDYPDRSVRLHFYLVGEWRDSVRSLTGQRLRWVAPDALEKAELLPADGPVVRTLRALAS